MEIAAYSSRTLIDFKGSSDVIGNTDISMQAKKRADAELTKFNRERAREIIRESCQHMCGLFNLFRGRSRFICLLLEDMFSNYCLKTKDKLSSYEECLNLVVGVVQVLVSRLSESMDGPADVGYY